MSNRGDLGIDMHLHRVAKKILSSVPVNCDYEIEYTRVGIWLSACGEHALKAATY